MHGSATEGGNNSSDRGCSRMSIWIGCAIHYRPLDFLHVTHFHLEKSILASRVLVYKWEILDRRPTREINKSLFSNSLTTWHEIFCNSLNEFTSIPTFSLNSSKVWWCLRGIWWLQAAQEYCLQSPSDLPARPRPGQAHLSWTGPANDEELKRRWLRRHRLLARHIAVEEGLNGWTSSNKGSSNLYKSTGHITLHLGSFAIELLLSDSLWIHFNPIQATGNIVLTKSIRYQRNIHTAHLTVHFRRSHP